MQPSIILWAGFAAALCVAALWRPWIRTEGSAPPPPAWAGVLPIALAFCVAYKQARGWPAFPPRELAHGLFYLVAGSPLLVLASRAGRLIGALAWAVAIALVLWQGLEPFRVYYWEGAKDVWGHAGLFAVALALVWLGTGIERARPSGVAFPMLATIAFGGGAQVLGQSTGATAHVAGGVAAACTVLAAVGLWRPALPTSRGVAAVALVALGGLLSIGGLFATTPRLSILILLALPGLAFALPPAVEGRRTVVVAVVAVALALVAAWLAVPEADPYGGY